MMVDISRLPLAAEAFVEQRLVPTLPEGTTRETFRWVVAGALALTGTRPMEQYRPVLEAQGIIENGAIDTDKLRTFFSAAFAKQNRLSCPFLGHRFTFDSTDGDALVSILETMT